MIISTNSPGRSVSRPAVNSGGSILITALWSVLLLSAFAVIIGAQARYEATLVKRLDRKTQLRFIAEAGVMTAIGQLEKESGNSYHCLTDSWSDNEKYLKGIDAGEGVFDVCYDAAYGASGVGQTVYGLVDEERKININTADKSVLRRLLRGALDIGEDKAQGIAASIEDWRDADEELSVPVGSAESMYYHGLVDPYASKNAAFDLEEELLLVRDVDREIFENIRGYITVYGSGMVNINTAPRQVLLAVGLDGRMADGILSFRKGKDGMTGTPDDGIFESTAVILPKMSQYMKMSPSDVSRVSAAVERYITVGSTAFRIRSVATAKNGKDKFTAVSVVDKEGKVLCWQES